MASAGSNKDPQNATPRTLELPAPTAWPIVLAFGVTLLSAGLVTSESVSLLGAILAVTGCAGWFLDIFPHEKHVVVQVEGEVPAVSHFPPRNRAPAHRSRTVACRASSRNLSRLRWRERRVGGLRSDGDFRHPLRDSEATTAFGIRSIFSQPLSMPVHAVVANGALLLPLG